MPEVNLDDETYERLLVTSHLMDETIGEVVRRLVDRLASESRPSSDPTTVGGTGPNWSPLRAQEKRIQTDVAEWLAIHKIYKGNRVEGTFNPTTHEVRLSTEPWTNKYFASPTAAAVAVVDHFSGDVRETNNTNGRKFWKISATGENLRSIIGER